MARNAAGEPLVLVMNTQSDQVTRQTDQLWKKDMDALGLRVALKTQQWPENLKQVRSGKFMLWRVGSSAATPDGQGALERIYGGSIGKGNISRFKLPALDKVYDDMRCCPTVRSARSCSTRRPGCWSPTRRTGSACTAC